MQKQQSQRPGQGRPYGRTERFVHQSRLMVTACEGCSRQLHKTHNYVYYGNVCRPCWLAAQAGATGMDGVSESESIG